MNPPPLSSPENPFGDPDRGTRAKQAAIGKGIFLGCGGCASLVVMVLLLVGGIFYFIFSGIRKTEPFQLTLQAAQSSPELRDQLGEPITLGFIFTGNVNWENGNGTANVHIPLNGPKGSATVHTIGTKTDNASWNFTQMQTTTSPPVNLLKP